MWQLRYSVPCPEGVALDNNNNNAYEGHTPVVSCLHEVYLVEICVPILELHYCCISRLNILHVPKVLTERKE